MTQRIDTVVIGAGQAGLAISYYLTQQARTMLCWTSAARSAAPGATVDGIPSP